MNKASLALTALLVLPACVQAAASRVLILSGSGKHDARVTSPHLRTILEQTGKFDVRLNEEPAGITAAALRAYDAILLNSVEPSPVVNAAVRAGKGLLVIHSGEGCGEKHPYRVKLADRAHPISRGLGESFLTADELYLKPAMRKDAAVLASAFDNPEFGGTGVDVPIAWTYLEGKGRVFHTALGHDLAALQAPGFTAMLARAAEWVVSGKVGAPQPARKPVRALVVTGGHDYETSFYTVFEQPGIVWTHASSSAEAFDKEFADKYDTVILYNMTEQISAQGKRNLQAFVEAGKGVVALHHGLISYNNWPFWFNEVTGARTIPRSGKPPGVGFQHDVELIVESTANHPITEGLTPMHIVDETYKGLTFSPKTQILLKTNHPTSDGPVAWIGPHPKARVVTIQLGHDHMAFLHAGFRALVRNAILWAAARP